MSFERSPPLIDLAIGRSYALALSSLIVCALGIAAVLLSGLAWQAKLVAILVLTLFTLWFILARALGLHARAIQRFVWQADGECSWQERGGRFHHGTVSPGGVVTPWLVVIHLRRGRLRRHSLCMARDAVDPEGLRRLRMRLRVSPPAAPAGLSRRLAGLFRR